MSEKGDFGISDSYKAHFYDHFACAKGVSGSGLRSPGIEEHKSQLYGLFIGTDIL